MSLTRLLNLAAAGDAQAALEVMPRIYDELRRIAKAKRRSAVPGETLRTTALIHEAYIRIVDREPDGWQARSHFFYAAARAMRDILVEDSRKRTAAKHGGDQVRVTLEDAGISVDAPPEQVLSLNRCIERLESDDDLGHKIVMFRFFVGMTTAEIADALHTPVRTVERKWTFLRAWLASELAAS
jgi:RNA polymerase sigma factor (TIGR02999 family)